MPSEKRAARRGAAVSAGLSLRSTATASGDACHSPFNKHTEKDQLADDMQEDEREADDDE